MSEIINEEVLRTKVSKLEDKELSILLNLYDFVIEKNK